MLLHDPQTVGMAEALARAGARVVWRCHVGREGSNEWTDDAWSFLRPHLEACEAYVFSLRQYIPPWLDETRARVIPPSIDPFSPKNQEMTEIDVTRTLGRIGLLRTGGSEAPGAFTRRGRNGWARRAPGVDRVRRAVGARRRLGPPGFPMGPVEGHGGRNGGLRSEFVAAEANAHLALVGPSVAEISDDPEGAQVFAECVTAWQSLPPSTRRHISLITLPMEDIDENAAMVNALQRHATVIVQKSLEEGFGLTVAEGMWKARAVVASRVGGIVEQIAPGTGVLLDDPSDLSAFGEMLAELLARPDQIAELGARARQHVLDGYVGDKHLLRYAQLVQWLASQD